MVIINQCRDVSCIPTYVDNRSAVLQALLSLVLTLLLRFGNSCVHIGLFRWRTVSCGQSSVKGMNSP